MKNYIYRLPKKIESTDIDFNLDLKLSSLFLFFQEIGGHQSDELGIGRKATTEKGLHWVITRFDVEINKMPRYGDEIYVETYPGDNNKLFFYRHFMIKDLKGNILIKANSIWLVLNAKTGMITKNPFEGILVPAHHEPNELPIPDKVNIIEGDLIYKKIIRYSDIDLNNHLNNTRYIELIQDSFDLDFYKKHTIKRISINFLAELKALDEVEVYRTNTNPYTVVGKKANKDHFVAELHFLEK